MLARWVTGDAADRAHGAGPAGPGPDGAVGSW